ncbi:MAG: sigma-54-dependent transcriptional regulator [Planctomycetota bacterium]|jgi:DNA-binding NtrC family response regulator
METAPAPSRSALSDVGRILVVDDEPSVVDTLSEILALAGLQAETTTDPREALDRITRGDYALLVTDLVMPGLDGMELLRRTRTISPGTEVVIVTGFGTVETAVEAIRAGASDFLTKPLESRRIIEVVGRVMELHRLRRENELLRAELADHRRPAIPSSAAMRRVFDMARELAASEATVLLLGETGTGKEILAEFIHRESPRAAGPLVKVNCSALPAQFLESELFGHVQGAFREAVGDRRGRLDLATGGTLFLDEVSELPAAAQVRLLRALEEGKFERVGGDEKIGVDARVVAATNRDLAALVRAGEFREDLYYRLSVVPIEVPPLRAHAEDIPVYAQHFLDIYARRSGGPAAGLSAETLELMGAYGWPGNIRELENALERAAILAKSGEILPEHLPPEVRSGPAELLRPASDPSGAGLGLTAVPRRLADIEREAIQAALMRSAGNLSRAARELGVSRTSLYDRIARYGLARPTRKRAGG